MSISWWITARPPTRIRIAAPSGASGVGLGPSPRRPLAPRTLGGEDQDRAPERRERVEDRPELHADLGRRHVLVEQPPRALEEASPPHVLEAIGLDDLDRPQVL